jgi:hypothetical protein
MMNAKSERESDPKNFGERIIEFRIVVGKMSTIEVSRTFL